jgi:hypothetical protein
MNTLSTQSDLGSSSRNIDLIVKFDAKVVCCFLAFISHFTWGLHGLVNDLIVYRVTQKFAEKNIFKLIQPT